MSYHEYRFLGHEWGDLPTIFTSDFVTRENRWQIASRVTQKIVTYGNECVNLFLTRYFMFWTHNVAKTIIDRWIRHCRQGRSFLTKNCEVTTIDLWRHANVDYWYCDVIFVDCSCKRKLAQRRSSLMNNSREYRFLTVRCSRLSV